MNTKYNTYLSENILQQDLTRLTNQIWKLIPMRENEEDWQEHLRDVIIEIAGLRQVLGLKDLLLLSKLEGLLDKGKEMPFLTYRKNVFRAINLLGGMLYE